ncbi:MAG: hypothetical protein KUG61_08440 [Parvibaculaceae bacterium]|nr:hypothetical protein [Parvibaculaceae bacterium]
MGFVKSLGDALLGAAEPTEKNEHQQGGAPADTSGGLENPDSSRVPELDDLDDGQALQQQLEALFDEPDALLAGNVQLIGLEKVRKALGGEWERLKATIHIALENLLASQLRPQDRYLRVGEDSFLIIFSEDDELFVSQAVAKIVGKMRDLLLGSALHENGGVDIRSIIGRLTQDEAGHAKFEAIEVEDEPVSSGAEKVGDKLSPAFVQSGEEEAAPKLRQVVERKSVAYETVYAPVWDAFHQVLSTYAVVPIAYGRNRNAAPLIGHDVLPATATDVEIAELDMKHLQIMLEMIGELYENEFAVFLVASVHFKTLSNGGLRDRYLALCRQTPEFLRKYISIQIVGVPPQVAESILTQRVAYLRPFFVGVNVRLSSLDVNALAYARSGVGGVTFCYPTDPVEMRAAPALIKRHVTDLLAHKIRLTIEMVPDLAVAGQLKDLRVTYLTGTCFGTLLDTPKNMKRYQLEDFATPR